MHTQRNTYACLLPTALLVFVMWHGSFAGESVVSPAVAMEIAIRAGDLRWSWRTQARVASCRL